MKQESTVSRRFFLKGVATAAISIPLASPTLSAGQANLWTMVIDLNKCIGCQSCTIACKAESGASKNVFNTRMLVDDSASSGRIGFTPQMCLHCDNPACLKACPFNAISKQADGIVVTDWNLCAGDGVCVKACPYAARTLDAERNYLADSCDFCLERLAHGAVPACVESCASGARIFGDALNPSRELSAALETGRKLNLQAPGRVFIIKHKASGQI